jgi:predicted DNA-binding transcriptional regulator
LRNLQNVVHFTRRDVLGQTTREKALEMLGVLHQAERRPIPARIIGQQLGVSDRRVWFILADAQRQGLARPIRQKGWVPVESSGQEKR